MILFWIVTGGLLLILGGYGLSLIFQKYWQRRNRRRLWKSPFSAAWDSTIRLRCRVYSKLSPAEQERLRKCVQVFLDEKSFEACGGLDSVTDEMKLVIAAQACLLLIGLKHHDYFGKLRSILVYPGAFRSGRKRLFALSDEEVRGERDAVLLGESWKSGSVVIGWESALQGAANDDDGENVVLHEFAHQLDQADGIADGAPILNSPSDYQDWARVLGHDFHKLVEESEAGKRELIDSYGATNPAEFFAVATETFFERPRLMHRKHRELYEELKQYYGLDPVKWELESSRAV